jgi:hypothetical protein
LSATPPELNIGVLFKKLTPLPPQSRSSEVWGTPKTLYQKRKMLNVFNAQTKDYITSYEIPSDLNGWDLASYMNELASNFFYHTNVEVIIEVE